MHITAELVRRGLPLIMLAAVAVGCGDGIARQSPAGPTEPSIASLPPGDPGARTALTGDGVGFVRGGRGHGPEKEKDGERDDEKDKAKDTRDDDDMPGRSHQARVVGFVTAKNDSRLTVNGISVVAARDAIIRHGHRLLSMRDIEVGDHVHARGAMDGSRLVAVEIKVQDTGNDNDD